MTTTKEPHIARYTSENAIVKDRFYYKSSDFSWNRPARINEKHYPYYHKQQNDNQPRIENMKKQELLDRLHIEETRKERLIGMKMQDRLNLESRIKEREALQRVSNQSRNSQDCPDTPEEDSRRVSEIVSKRLNSGKDLRTDEFGWNLLNQASKKNIDIYLGSFTLKGEEDMIRSYKEKIEEEKRQEEEDKRRQSDFHKKIRVMFVNRQEENMAKEELIGRPLTAKSKFYSTPRQKSPNTDQVDTQMFNVSGAINSRPSWANSADLRLKDALVGKLYEKASRVSVTPSVDKLALSREPVRKEFNPELTDLKGTLVQNMDGKIFLAGNRFHETLVTQSKVFQEILDNNKNNSKKNITRRTFHSRPMTCVSQKTIPTRPFTTQSKFAYCSNPSFSAKSTSPSKIVFTDGIVQKSSRLDSAYKSQSDIRIEVDDINNNKTTAREIEAFENKFCRGGKKMGYARVNLEEAYRLTSAFGLTASEKMEAKKLEPLVK